MQHTQKQPPPSGRTPAVPYAEYDPFCPTPRQRRIARGVIAFTGFVTLLAFALIFYRSFHVHEPNSAIVVEGDESLDGAEITVRRVLKGAPAINPQTAPTAAVTPDGARPTDPAGGGPAEPPPAAIATLNKDNNYVTPVLLDPGLYMLTVRHQGRVILHKPFFVEERRGLIFPLALLRYAATRPVVENEPPVAPAPAPIP